MSTLSDVKLAAIEYAAELGVAVILIYSAMAVAMHNKCDDCSKAEGLWIWFIISLSISSIIMAYVILHQFGVI